MKKILFEELKQQVVEVLKNNKHQCSVSIANIDSNTTFSANLSGARISWGESEMVIFALYGARLAIPYAEIKELSIYSNKHIGFLLEKRILVTIRETYKPRRGA